MYAHAATLDKSPADAMNPDPPDRRATDLFCAALELAPEARAAYVERACAGDDALRRRVERLLTLDERSAGLLEPCVEDGGAGSVVAEMLASMDASFLHRTADAVPPGELAITGSGAGGETRRHSIVAGASAGADDGLLSAESFPGFTLRARIGEGGFGAVYRAHDSRLTRDVALKVLLPRARVDPAIRQRFLHEARILAQVRHANVITVHAVLEEKDRIGLVMELIDGETLEEFVERTDCLGAQEASQIGLQLCAALAAVHGRGLIHRDVKPANVLRERGGRIVLCDFGLGVFVAPDRGVDSAGTPLFMAPEQIHGVSLDCRADIYALGVLLYWCVTKEFPYPVSPQASEVLAAKLTRSPTPLRDRRPDLPGRFVEVVHRALERDPDARFASAGEFEQSLVACLGAPGASPVIVPPPASPAPRSVAPRRQRALLAVTAALAAVLLVVNLAIGLPGALRRSPILEASLWRERAWETERLRPGDSIRPQDDLYLHFAGTRSLFVYVLSVDGEGDTTVVFPVRGAVPQNPLADGIEHVLPGTRNGSLVRFRLDDARGAETIVVVAASARIDELELLSSEAGDSSPPIAVVTRSVKAREKSFDPATDGKEFLAAFIARIESDELGDRSRGPWVETIRLDDGRIR